MKNLGFYNFYSIYNNNRMFNPEIQAPIGDDLLYPFHHLAQVAPAKRYIRFHHRYGTSGFI